MPSAARKRFVPAAAAAPAVRWAHVLERWKANAGINGEAVVLTRNPDSKLVLLCAMWPRIAPPWERDELVPPMWAKMTDEQLWTLVWDFDAISELVADACGLTYGRAQSAVRIAVMGKLIFPDGSIGGYVDGFLRSETLRQLGKKLAPSKGDPK